MMKTSTKFAAALVAACWLAGSAAAKVSQADADRLGKDLTPVGAEKAGNKDGTIPAWDGGMTKPPAGFQAGSGNYVDPFGNEKPLFTITAQNVAQYKDKLSVGQQAMFKKYPEYKMNVYPSHRTVAMPQALYDCAKKAAVTADLTGGGNGVTNPTNCNIPFPVAKTPYDVMWNHVMHNRGGGVDRTYAWFPVQANGSKYKVTFRETFITNPNMDEQKPNRLFYFRGWYTAPATLEGTVYLVHEPIDQVAESRSAWIYNAGQRRVRRVPELAYDYMADGVEGLRTTDQYDAYNGAPDRYDWKLIGKKEIYIPYNPYKLADKKLKYEDIVKTGHANQDLMRYELHRVWVVEAILKPGTRHIYGKRTYYVDEDSWMVALEDSYDTRGQLWRFMEGHIMNYYDVLAQLFAANFWYDLNSGAYLASGLMNEEKMAVQFNVKGKFADFQADNLRRLGTK